MQSNFLVVILLYSIVIETIKIGDANIVTTLFSIGDIDLKLSGFVKIIIFFLWIKGVLLDTKLQNSQKAKLHYSIPLFTISVLLSTFSLIIINPKYFPPSVTVCAHVLLTFSIIPFLAHSKGNIKNDVQYFLKHLSLFGALTATSVWISFIMPEVVSIFEAGYSQEGAKRAFGFMGDQASTFLTFFAYYELCRKNNLLFFFYSIAIFFTGGIGAIFTWSISLIYYYSIEVKITQNTVLIYLFILSVFLGIFLIFPELFLNISAVQRLMNGAADTNDNSSGALRLLSLTTATEMMIKKPVFGYGFGAYSFNVYDSYYPLWVALEKEYRFNSDFVIIGSAFNQFVQFICEMGLVGLTVFLLLIRHFQKVTKKFYKDLKDKNILYFKTASKGWIPVFVFSTLSVTWILPNSFLWVLVCIIIGLNYKINYYQTNVR